MSKKVREIIPALEAAILALVEMHADAAKLEMGDNDQASRRLKRAVTKFKNHELQILRDLAYDTRSLIANDRKKKALVNKANKNPFHVGAPDLLE